MPSALAQSFCLFAPQILANLLFVGQSAIFRVDSIQWGLILPQLLTQRLAGNETRFCPSIAVYFICHSQNDIRFGSGKPRHCKTES